MVMTMVVVMAVVVVMMVMADDDKVLAMPADIVDTGHSERNVASVREPRVRLQLQLFSVHAGRLRMLYGCAVQMEHIEHLEACKLTSIFVLFPPNPHPRRWPASEKGGRGQKWENGKERDAP